MKSTRQRLSLLLAMLLVLSLLPVAAFAEEEALPADGEGGEFIAVEQLSTAEREPVAEDEPTASEEPITEDEPATEEEPVAEDEPGVVEEPTAEDAADAEEAVLLVEDPFEEADAVGEEEFIEDEQSFEEEIAPGETVVEESSEEEALPAEEEVTEEEALAVEESTPVEVELTTGESHSLEENNEDPKFVETEILIEASEEALEIVTVDSTAAAEKKSTGTVVFDGNSMSTFSRTQKQVQNKYRNAIKLYNGYVDYDSNTYFTVPSSLSAPYQRGVLASSTLEAMGAMANFYRWLSGSKPAAVRTTNNPKLQAEALVRNFEFDHYISDSSRPEDMSQELWNEGAHDYTHNILAMYYTPRGAIAGWMNEGYSLQTNTWDTLGHRAAIISPSTETLEFGYSGWVAAGDSEGGVFVYGLANDDNGDGIIDDQDESYVDSLSQQGYWGFKEAFTAFPCPGPMPNWVIRSTRSAWSVWLDMKKIRAVDLNGVSVKVTNLSTGKTYICTEENGLARVFYDVIEFVQPNDYSNSRTRYDSDYRVEITGLQDRASGEDAIITYVVNFFAYEPETKITSNPTNVNADIGSTAVFKVEASGEELEYQWQWNDNGTWKNCGSTGNKTSTLSVNATAGRNNMQYQCVVSGGDGNTVYSWPAILTINTRITTQPKDVTTTVGSTAKFSVKATGASLKYQWQWNDNGTWKNCGSTGNKTSTLSVNATAGRNNMQYRCVVTGGNGNTLYSEAATLRINTMSTKITTQPKDVTTTVGSTATFKVTATGANLKYQWQWRASSSDSWKTCGSVGNQTVTLQVNATAGRNGVQYRCRVTGANGTVYSNAATLKIGTKITSQPKSVTTYSGRTATFKVTATGANLKYQWQWRASSSDNWKTCGSAGNQTVTLRVNATAGRNGVQYRCRVTGANGTVYSNAATLTVK